MENNQEVKCQYKDWAVCPDPECPVSTACGRPEREPEAREAKLITAPEIEKMDDKELLEGCRKLTEMLMVKRAQPYFDELFKRFDNYRKVRSIFYRLSKREF
jgi:hypothetical protein